MKTQKFVIIPAEIARTVTVSGYFETFSEINQTYESNKAAYLDLERQRAAVGYPERYSNYSSFRSAKYRFDKTFSGEVKYI